MWKERRENEAAKNSWESKTAMPTYYDEVRDVLDDEGGSEEVPDVDAGFRAVVPDVGLPEAALPEVLAADVRLDASQSSAAFFQYS